jgi:hypothetical protein
MPRWRQPTVTVISATEVDIVYSLKNGGAVDANGYTLAEDLLAVAGGATSASDATRETFELASICNSDSDYNLDLDFLARVFSTTK